MYGGSEPICRCHLAHCPAPCCLLPPHLPPQVEAAETIVVVGGGSVGVEIAAEVAERHPSKKARGRRRPPAPAASRRACWPALSPAVLPVRDSPLPPGILQVTLVCSGALLARMDAKAQAFAADWLQKHGVEVLTGERIRWGWGRGGDGLRQSQSPGRADGGHRTAQRAHCPPNHPTTWAPAATGAAWATACRRLPH